MSDQKNSYLGPMIVIGGLFFIFGFVTWLNGPLITFVKLNFNLKTDGEAFWVTFAFYMAYFVLALPSSWILEKTGMKKGMALGLMVMAIGTFIFGQFATARNYGMSLLGLFVTASGMTVLQTASNPYIAIIGPMESAAQRISVMGICNKVGGIISPIVIGAFVLTDIDKFEDNVKNAANEATRSQLLTEFASKVYTPYMIMAGILVLLAFWIIQSRLPEIKASEVNKEAVGSDIKGKTSLFQFPYLLLGVICLFLYVGAEVMAGDAIGTYGKGFSISSDETKYFTSFTLGAMLIGYLIGLVTIPTYLSQENALKYSAISGIIFTTLAFFTHGYVSVVFVAALGLSNALMWPAIWPLAISGLGKYTEKGSALLIMGIAGGAIIPKIFAEVKTDSNFQLVFFLLMLPCYIYILYFATKGYLVGRPKA